MANFNFRAAARTLMLSLGFAAALPAAQAFSQDIQTYRDEINKSQNRFENLKVTYKDKMARYDGEISQITSWIDEAQILASKKETEKVRILALKINVYINFVDASLQRDEAMTGAMEAESRLKSLKAEFGKVEAQVQQMEAEEKVLQDKLSSITKK